MIAASRKVRLTQLRRAASKSAPLPVGLERLEAEEAEKTEKADA
jgi:hypothetical protein